VVFTLPHALNPIVLKHKAPLLNTLFAAVSETLLVFGQNKLGGRLGFISILHTWDQKLKAHFHLHCLVAGGVISADWNTWSASPNRYLFNAQALSQVFRGKFMARLTHAVNTHQISLPPNSYPALNDRLYANPWVVSVRPPIRPPQHVLEYLEPYPRSYIITQSSLSIGMTKMAIKCTKYITVYQTRWIVIATTTNNFSCNERYFCRQIFWKRNL